LPINPIFQGAIMSALRNTWIVNEGTLAATFEPMRPVVTARAPHARAGGAGVPAVAGTLRNMALFLLAPFVGLAYAVLLPFIGLAMLAWFTGAALLERG
jgi:hypothetical protein